MDRVDSRRLNVVVGDERETLVMMLEHAFFFEVETSNRIRTLVLAR